MPKLYTFTTAIAAAAVSVVFPASSIVSTCHAFHTHNHHRRRLASTSGVSAFTTNQYGSASNKRMSFTQPNMAASTDDGNRFAVKSTDLDDSLLLNLEEKTIVGVSRSAGPSVAFVSSFLNPDYLNNNRNKRSTSNNNNGRQRQRRRGRRTQRSENESDGGRPLGSGSGFIVSSDGYMVTNYHVIQQAYELNKSASRLKNNTDWFINNSLLGSVLGRSGLQDRISSSPAAVVRVRVNSATKFRYVKIVDVRPDLDVAVLKIEPDGGINGTSSSVDTESFPAIPYGSSSDLLVGQRVVAIGNPFGLDQTVTSGVVSALNREVGGVAGNVIRNCIQTDAAINPGNSGGPLLNSRGLLVGVNTAIISTTGSNAGIGFAIPVDQVKKATNAIIKHDRLNSSGNNNARKTPGSGYLGVECASCALRTSILKGTTSSNNENNVGVLILRIKPNSPAEKAGLQAMELPQDASQKVVLGDLIVAVNGNNVNNESDMERELGKRIMGEQINVTVENPMDGSRRVVYLTLEQRKN